MLDITTSINDSLDRITVVFNDSDIDVNNGSITQLVSLSGVNINILYVVVNPTTIYFDVEEDSEYSLSFFHDDGETPAEYQSITLLVNPHAILCGNRKNRYDVTSLLKVKKLDNTSRITDCLNRVVIANHRLSKYVRAAEILQLVINNCGEDCIC